MGRNPEEDPQYKDVFYSPYANNGANIREQEQERVRRQTYVTNDTLRGEHIIIYLHFPRVCEPVSLLA